MGVQHFVKESKGKKVPVRHFICKNLIDGIGVTKEIKCNVSIFLPLWSRIGNNRVCVLYIPYEALIGEHYINIPRPKGSRLQ